MQQIPQNPQNLQPQPQPQLALRPYPTQPVAPMVPMSYPTQPVPQQASYQPPHRRNEYNELHTKINNLEQQLGKMNFLLENFIMAQQTQGQFFTQPQ